MLRSEVIMNESIARDNLEAFKVLFATGAHDASQLLARVAACGSVRMLEMLAVPGVDPNARLCAPGCAFDGGTALHCTFASYETREAVFSGFLRLEAVRVPRRPRKSRSPRDSWVR
jgi:hypothetical protein